jgi:hypothetical protein
MVIQFADPFVFVDNLRNIWVFYEEKSKQEKGILKCVGINSDVTHKLDLGVNCHLSFPYVFIDNGEYYMIPETCELNEVVIYKSENFPIKWKRFAKLLEGEFVDSYILKYAEIYYLFTTEKVDNSERYNLQLYTSQDLFSKFKIHPSSPIKIGRKYGRSGGSIIEFGNVLYRFSQNCENRYGEDLLLFQIIEISENTYKEKQIEKNYIRNHFGNENGGHHISICTFDNDKTLIAVDLSYKDNYFQRFFD